MRCRVVLRRQFATLTAAPLTAHSLPIDPLLAVGIAAERQQ